MIDARSTGSSPRQRGPGVAHPAALLGGLAVEGQVDHRVNAVLGAGTVQRCVVSTGTAGGVTRRVIQRVVSSSGANPFPVNDRNPAAKHRLKR